MMTFKYIKASDYCKKVADGTHDSPKRQEKGKYLITSRHIKGRNIDFENAYLISEEDFNQINQRSKVDQWDILISMIGEYCGFSYVERNEIVDYAVKNVGIFKTENKIKAEWLYYYLTSPEGRNTLLTLRSGTSQPYIPLGALRALEIPIPEEETKMEQITSILSSLDDKIELNLQMNQTLEAMAKAIFKEWFVNFNFPGFDGELVDGLPKGWRKGRLGEILELQYGKALKAEIRIAGEYPVIGSSGIVDYHNEYLVEAPGIVIGRKGTIGEVVWIDENFYPIDTTFYVKDLLKLSKLHFHYFLLKEQEFKKIASDSAVPGLNRNQAMNNIVVIPDVNVISIFNSVIDLIFLKKRENASQINNLTLLRDGLLPKLMTGKIEIKA